ncbi:hypothetical protein CR513_05840, partial [Mucuna pruriens]
VVAESDIRKRHTDEIEALRRENNELRAQFRHADAMTNKQSPPAQPSPGAPNTPSTREHPFVDRIMGSTRPNIVITTKITVIQPKDA